MEDFKKILRNGKSKVKEFLNLESYKGVKKRNIYENNDQENSFCNSFLPILMNSFTLIQDIIIIIINASNVTWNLANHFTIPTTVL